jgi:hypothetical protein
MQFIIKFIRLLFNKKEIKMNLGRWNIDYCNKKINRKIDLSNTDHCGPCGIKNINNK